MSLFAYTFWSFELCCETLKIPNATEEILENFN